MCFYHSGLYSALLIETVFLQAFSVLTRLLSETFSSDQSREWKLGVTSKVLADTVHCFNGQPPAWVYAEMSKPLSLLLGVDGYHQMVNKSMVFDH